jgi:hypothetical protein
MYGAADMTTIPQWLEQFKAEGLANDCIGCLIVSLLLIGLCIKGVA